MNCTARCKGSQEALRVYTEGVREDAKILDFKKRDESGEFDGDEAPSKRASEFIETMRAILRRPGKN